MERRELHRRIELLQKKLKEGQIKFAPDIINGFWESIKKVKILPDGMVDAETVDETIKSLCIVIACQNDRQEWRDVVSLKQIQEGYFQIVENAFGHLFEMMTKKGENPYKFSSWFSSEQSRVEESIPVLDEFLEEIKRFS